MVSDRRRPTGRLLRPPRRCRSRGARGRGPEPPTRRASGTAAVSVIPRRTGFFPPEILEDVRRVGRRLVPRRRTGDGDVGRAPLVWLWLLLLLYPFTDYIFTV